MDLIRLGVSTSSSLINVVVTYFYMTSISQQDLLSATDKLNYKECSITVSCKICLLDPLNDQILLSTSTTCNQGKQGSPKGT